ncbi:hypothetical protein PHYBOEH_002575 [Phytophthora boehmeriae]|uniref:Phospholipase/carboxylesterase/thioesterase domain-containing protein n=1 Tax=Phytophthora boehmeriae TaxID=109152 RepID=A0A8T1WQT7_9STRA|nr:hypothetical protein PHYBOEH_002575 [Phytophthora boehmeriae]
MADPTIVRVHPAARLALVRDPSGRTRWILHSPSDDASPPRRNPSAPIELRPRASRTEGAGRLDWDALDFPDRPCFELIASEGQDAPPTQNVVVFLHGRGDCHEPFARLGAQMALPQTAVVSLRAPLELPFGLGFTWMEDLDDHGDAIPLDVPHTQRSQSDYGWSYSRLFLFAFSQGACVAFHLAMTLPQDIRLGGVVLVAGGAIAGPHSSATDDANAAATPMLQITGAADTVYPKALAERSRREFRRRHTQRMTAELFMSVVRPDKAHAMIDSRADMQHVMVFFSKHLCLRNIELENRSDIIELQT